MSDARLRDLERSALAGDTETLVEFYRLLQRSCHHSWDSCGVYSGPHSVEISARRPGLGEVRVDFCWICHATRVVEGVPLCFICNEPLSGRDHGRIDEPPVDGDDWPRAMQEWAHVECAHDSPMPVDD